MAIQQTEFENLVAEAVDALPPVAHKAMRNVVFIVEPVVRRAKAQEMRIKRGTLLLGLYEGVSKLARGANYTGVLPDKITIFEEPIRMLAGNDPSRLKALVFDVVRHEVGHHLGFDESGIRAYERARKSQKK